MPHGPKQDLWLSLYQFQIHVSAPWSQPWRSIGSSCVLMVRMESTTASAKTPASSAWTLGHRCSGHIGVFPCPALRFLWPVLKTEVPFPLQLQTFCYYTGMRPSETERPICFSSSPMTRALEVVPSSVMSSWAVATLVVKEAVGCCICISWSSTLPSLVSLSPAPEQASSWCL